MVSIWAEMHKAVSAQCEQHQRLVALQRSKEVDCSSLREAHPLLRQLSAQLEAGAIFTQDACAALLWQWRRATALLAKAEWELEEAIAWKSARDAVEARPLAPCFWARRYLRQIIV